MTSFISKKNIEDIVKDGVIITTGATGILLGLKAAGVKLPSLDAIFIVKLASEICGERWQKTRLYIKDGLMIDTIRKNFMTFIGL